jgi:uncharacterized protein (DUF3820 family)
MSDVMPFGKHKSKTMDSIPMPYLLWCVKEMKKCPLIVIQEIDRRTGLDGLSGKSIRKYQRIKETGGLTYKGTIVGRDYRRLREEFERADGDPSDCPFDTEDYQYTGPTIHWVGGHSVVSPSEFPRSRA